jgi:uncharacterized protein involved in exopolysaccharide biosynthesis
MIEHGPNAPAEQRPTDEEESGGLDLEQIREMAGFALHSARRRPVVFGVTFGVVAVLGVTVGITMPRTYGASVKVLAQRSSTMRVLSGQNLQLDQVDNPTKDVAAMILRRDNIVALVRDAQLLQRVQEVRPAALKFKDRFLASVFGAPSATDRELGMVYTLERSLKVVTDGDTVEITVDWANPQIAFDLATRVEGNFLEARYDGDVAMVNDSIRVLEDHTKAEAAKVDEALKEYEDLVGARAAALPAASATTVRSPAGLPVYRSAPATSPAIAEIDPNLARQLEAKRAQIRSLEDGQQRALESFGQKLAEAQLTLTPMHPTVVALRQQVDTLSQPSPELIRLRGEVTALMDQIAAQRPSAAPASPSAPAFVVRATAAAIGEGPGLPRLAPLPDRDGLLNLTQSKLEAATREYEEAMRRSDAAHTELDITRTSFKHRYTVVTPAELPRKPKKPTAWLIGLGAPFGAALLALLLVTAADLASGVTLEAWQVKRRLKVDVIGEFDWPA